jgi:hypothetical protein
MKLSPLPENRQYDRVRVLIPDFSLHSIEVWFCWTSPDRASHLQTYTIKTWQLNNLARFMARKGLHPVSQDPTTRGLAIWYARNLNSESKI